MKVYLQNTYLSRTTLDGCLSISEDSLFTMFVHFFLLQLFSLCYSLNDYKKIITSKVSTYWFFFFYSKLISSSKCSGGSLVWNSKYKGSF